MEEIIKELEGHYNRISAEEIYEIYQLASEYFKKMDLLESRIQSNEFRDLKENNRNQTLAGLLAGKNGKESMPSLEELISITKFDEEHYLKYEKEVREKNPERTQILFYLHSFLNMFHNGHNSIFLEFAELKRMFNYLHISAHKQVRAFVEIIQNNGLLGEGKTEMYLPDYEALANYPYEHISAKEVSDIILNEKLEEFLKDENPDNLLGQRELLKCIEQTRENYTAPFLASLELDRLFATKAYDLTEEDYQTVREKMEFLSFGDIADRVIRQMRGYAKTFSNQMKNDKKVEIKVEITVPKKQTSLNQTLREIGTYYDIDDKKIKETLSMDKIIYVLSLMYSISMEKDSIDAFLRSAMREFKNMHPYAIYNQAYDKFAFLGKNDAEIREHLEMIEYILSDTSIFICDEEEYVETKALIEEELNEIMRLSKGNFAYEEESAKKLCKE